MTSTGSYFWMAFDDFVAAFTSMWACQTYKETEYTRVRRLGTWPSEGGGCLNYDSWVGNPQLYLDVPPATVNASVTIVLTQARILRSPSCDRCGRFKARSSCHLFVGAG